MNRLPAVVLAAVLAFSGCSRKAALETGTVEGDTYRNDYFGMTVQIPEKMCVMSREEMDEIAAGLQVFANETDISTTERALSNMLLFASHHDLGSSAQDSVFNYNLSVIALQLAPESGITNNHEYETAMEALSAAQGNSIAVAPQRVMLGGREFLHLSSPVEIPAIWFSHGHTVQDNYTRVEGGYSLTIMITYDADNQKAKADALLSGIRFDE